MLVIWLGGFNQSLFYLINTQYAILPDKIWNAIDFTASSQFLPILLVVIVFLCKREYTFRAILIVVGYVIIFAGLKILVGEARPYAVLPLDSFHWINNLSESTEKAYKSFPSGHTARAAIFAFTLIALFCQNSKYWLRILLFIFLIMVMVTKICTGWHWPLDVLASCVISYVLVKCCLCICLKGNKNAEDQSK